jgi:integral membrane protein (TIGR00529 family)
MNEFVWIGFILSVLTILVLSRWHLGLSLFVASLVLAVFTMGPDDFGGLGIETFTDAGVLLLAGAVALIPLIGGIMESSGQMDSLVNNLRIKRRTFLGVSPALVGMLPMPGGALLSAPLVKRGGAGVRSDTKVALNVWFRHVIYLVYPLSTALIVSTYLAGLGVYDVIPYLLPFFVLTILLGYVFFLREARGRIASTGPFRWAGLLLPLTVLLAAPLIDFALLQGFRPSVREFALIIGVIVSLSLALYFAHLRRGQLMRVARKMKPWNFGLIILGMFLFLAVFKSSGVPELIASLNLPVVVLCVGVGFILGLVTGRIQVPASIIIPIYLGSTGLEAMSPWPFALTYISIFIGYVISPVHPCISVSLEYFKVDLRGFFTRILIPAIVVLVVTLVLGLLVF